MGIYYAAVYREVNKYFESPREFSIKMPGIFHPQNPFPQMVVMMNSLGNDFKIENDFYMPCYYDDCEDITEIVYEKFLQYYPWAKDFYEMGL